MHEWSYISQFCVHCGVGRAEALNWKISCYPSARGVAFTMKKDKFIEDFTNKVVERLLQSRQYTF